MSAAVIVLSRLKPRVTWLPPVLAKNVAGELNAKSTDTPPPNKSSIVTMPRVWLGVEFHGARAVDVQIDGQFLQRGLRAPGTVKTPANARAPANAELAATPNFITFSHNLITTARSGF